MNRGAGSHKRHSSQYYGFCCAHRSVPALADRIKIAGGAKVININSPEQHMWNRDGGRSCYGCSVAARTAVFVTYLYDGTRQSYTACSSKSKEGLLLRLILWRSRGNSASALSTTVMLYQRESSPRWRRSRRSAPFSSWTGHQRILKCGVNRQPSTVVPGEDMVKVIRPSTCLNGDRESEEDAAVEGQCRTAHAKGACTHLSSARLLLPVCSDMCTCNQL